MSHEAVGVHVSTVSRALDPKTRHLITPEVAEAILKASRRLDYRQNAAAYSLKTNRTRTVGVVLPDITNPIFPPIIRGVEDALARPQLRGDPRQYRQRLRREQSITGTLRARGVDALILASVEREDAAVARMAAEGLPIVTVNRQVDDPQLLGRPRRERRHPPHLAHLASLGPPESPTSPARRSFRPGRRAISPSSATAPPSSGTDPSSSPSRTFQRGRKASAAPRSSSREGAFHRHRLLQRPPGDRGDLRPRPHGVTCPAEVSVTGYNDMPMVDRLFPPLTTIRIQQYRAGFEAAELSRLLQTPVELRQPRHIVLPVELIVRGSTRSATSARWPGQ